MLQKERIHHTLISLHEVNMVHLVYAIKMVPAAVPYYMQWLFLAGCDMAKLLLFLASSFSACS